MKLGLGTYSFRWSIGHKDIAPKAPMRALDIIDIADAHGLEVVQFADNLPVHRLDDAERSDLRARAEAAGIAIELGLQGFDLPLIHRYVDICGEMGAGILRMAIDGPEAARPVIDLASDIRTLVPALQQNNVRLAIENHFDFPSDKLVQLVEATESNSVGVCLDVANSICAREWPEQTISALAPHAINLHLKDYVIKPDPYGVGFTIHGTPLGQGLTDASAVLEALPRAAGMSVILEQWLPLGNNLAAACDAERAWLSQSVEFVRNELGLKRQAAA